MDEWRKVLLLMETDGWMQHGVPVSMLANLTWGIQKRVTRGVIPYRDFDGQGELDENKSGFVD